MQQPPGQHSGLWSPAFGAGSAASGGRFHADTHLHSKYSRACSKDCDLEHLAWWALRKGISVVGTGDFTHPAWAEEITEKLVPAEPGLFRLRDDLERHLRRASPGPLTGPIRFMLSVEISTIYRRAVGADERTRKVHHLLYAPTFAAAGRIRSSLGRIGNLASDGRPILGLDSRDLLEITLESDPGSYLIPAHAWTPWFAVLGSKSGFDAVSECYADLAGHVFAVETGLSSDPPMNWMCSALDSYRLVSNSDAHSPPMLGREATTFCTDLDYFAIRRALETGEGLAGTVEFFPEEGKYHLDGHRKCGIRFSPAQTRQHGGDCPECGKPLTIGVLHRVAELADRPAGYRPASAPGYRNLVQLPEILAELTGTGPKSKRVAREAARLVAQLGPELAILDEVPAGDIARAGGNPLAEAISRLRRGEVAREAGFDGEYGVIRLLKPGGRAGDGTRGAAAAIPALFDVPAGDGELTPAAPPVPAGSPRSRPARRQPGGPARARNGRPGNARAGSGRAGNARAGSGRAGSGNGHRLLDDLDPEQRAAAAADPADRPALLVVAGPGTGKTRTLTYRIGYLAAERGIPASRFLAVTFTRRAAEEMAGRLARLLPGGAGQPTVTTFHGLGLRILREQHDAAGLPARFGIADEAARLAVAADLAPDGGDGRALLDRTGADPAVRAAFRDALRSRGLTDFAGLIELPAMVLRDDPALAGEYRGRWPHISVDEYQDIDAAQYALLRLLAGPHPAGWSLTAIGDPDQAIYGFRGADPGFFLRFGRDFPGAATVTLTRNYRSSPDIVQAAMQAIAPGTLVPGRRLRPVATGDTPAPDPARDDAAGAGSIAVHEAADEHAEAHWIAHQIDGLLGGSSFHSIDSGRADGYGQSRIGLADIAILCRTGAQAGPLIQALTRAGLPVQNRSHDRLADRPGVHALLRQMRLTGPAAAGTASPGTGAPRSAADCAGAARREDSVRTDGDAELAGSVADRLRAAVRTVTGLLPAASPAALDVRAAAEVLLPLARRCGRDLERFGTEVALGAEADAADPRADAVRLLTLHAAKGLQFPVVFVAGCEDGLLPLRAAIDRAEERRVLFVGMTRARGRLFLSYARRRTGQSAIRGSGRPSPFIGAIGPGLLEWSRQRPGQRNQARQLRLL